jgi:Tfp pilus assembly protein PilF
MLTDKYNQAEHVYNQVLEGNPDSARALCGHGALAATRGQWDRALELFQEALCKRPEYDVALAGLGLCATQHKKPEDAWNFYRRALKSNPENIRALLGIIEMGYSLQRLTEVEDVLKQYLDCHPADLDFMYSLAGCYFAQGKVAQAAEAINTITLFEPRHQHALELRAMIEKQGESITA